MNDITVPLVGGGGALTGGPRPPGPTSAMAAPPAVAAPPGDGLAAALGMGAGGIVFAVAALVGLQATFLAVPALYLGVKLLGGAYLVYLGIRIWRGAREPLAVSQEEGSPGTRGNGWRAFLLGMGTQISNPKTAVVYASIFAAFLPREVPLALALAVPAVIFCIETGWYSIVALALSSAAPRSAYLRYKAWIDRAAGGVMVLLGVKLLSGARGG